jgi:hypothetical protein
MSNTKKTGALIMEAGAEIKELLSTMSNRLDEFSEKMSEQDEYISRLNQKVEELTKRGAARKAGGSGPASSDARRVNALYKKLENDEHAHVLKAKEENIKAERSGTLRVGRIAPRMQKGPKFPYTEGFLNVAVTSHNKAGVGAELSPFVLSNEEGHIMENIWQCAKLYPFVPDIDDSRSGWTWRREVHINPKTQNINPAYWEWRNAGMTFDKPLRYPVGSQHRHYAKCHVWPTSNDLNDAINMTGETPMEKLPYAAARIKIYCPVYMEMASKTKDFATLRELLDAGYNIQILDVDGPERTKNEDGSVTAPYDQMPESTLEHNAYGESGVGSIEINEDNIKTMLMDEDQPFGHGYALACALLGHPEWVTEFPIENLPTLSEEGADLDGE